jgi:hypothetical protein
VPGALGKVGDYIRSAVRFETTYRREKNMSVAKVTEISATSTKSFDDAVAEGIKRADKTLENVTGAWINEMKVDVKDGKIVDYRVNMKVTFILKG